MRFAADIGSPGGELDAKRTEGWFLIPGLRAIRGIGDAAPLQIICGSSRISAIAALPDSGVVG